MKGGCCWNESSLITETLELRGLSLENNHNKSKLCIHDLRAWRPLRSGVKRDVTLVAVTVGFRFILNAYVLLFRFIKDYGPAVMPCLSRAKILHVRLGFLQTHVHLHVAIHVHLARRMNDAGNSHLSPGTRYGRSRGRFGG